MRGLVVALAASATLAPASPAWATDRWSPLAPGVRYLLRTTRHRDGAPLTVHALEIDLCAPGLELVVTPPEHARRRTSTFARAVGALAAVNGDYFDPRTLVPLGPTRGAGRDWPARSLYYYGGLLAFHRGESPSFFRQGPVPPRFADVLPTQERIVRDGAIELDPAIPHPGHRHPRSGYGFTRDGRTMLVVVVDGRSPRSAGVSTREYAALLISMGVWQGIKLDGGGSSTLWLRERGVVNRPSDGFERGVGNHLALRFDPDRLGAGPSYCPESPASSAPDNAPPAASEPR